MNPSSSPLETALIRAILWHPDAIERGLARRRAAGVDVPNAWQIALGVVRMWHRVLFRSETIGLCEGARVRPTWRARLLSPRPLRFPFLLAEGAVAPWDFSGLWSSRERVIRHLLGAHHDGAQFVYDLEMLAAHPGALPELVARARAVVEGTDPRAAWLRDLCVFEGYHESLLAAAEAALAGTLAASPDPDISFDAYLRWCARQPPTAEATWAEALAGRFTIDGGLLA